MIGKAKVLFVDDEKRVLNSMRGLFRRDYELFLTTDGAEAVDLVAKHDIDVIVADQRMPGLTGVQVLGQVREVSPRTVRILLTGYADPKAIEGSINVGEVFRFLSKPCQPKLLRETVKLAIHAAQASASAVRRTLRDPLERTAQPGPQSAARPAVAAPTRPPTAAPRGPQPAAVTVPAAAARPAMPATPAPRVAPLAASRQPAQTTRGRPVQPPRRPHGDGADRPAPTPAAPEADSLWQSRTEVVMSGDSSQEIKQLRLTQEANASIRNVGVAVFTVNPSFAESAIRSISADRSATLATTLVKVAEVLEQREAGVLVTDFSSDIRLLQNMIGALKQHLPELVTIVVSEHRDATDMINLINYGQVFRYVEKPIDAISLRTDVNAAVLKHLQLLEHPELLERHQVVDLGAAANGSQTLNNFIGRVTEMRGRWAQTGSKPH